MRPALLLAALLLAAPADAQEEAPSLMERGLRLLMEGLAEEMAPALRELSEEALPLMEELSRQLGDAFAGLDAYHPPEVLPNGDILIRRKPAPPEEGERLPAPGAIEIEEGGESIEL